MQLTEALLAKIAGWEAMKRARGLVAANQVSGSNWTPPTLRGQVCSGTTNYRAGLVIQSTIEVENLCSCRESRERGIICAHSIAIGLHYLLGLQPPVESQSGRENTPLNPQVAGPQYSASQEINSAQKSAPAVEGAGELLELYVILPPNLETAIAKDRILVCLEGAWRGRRQPLSAIPLTPQVRLAPSDLSVLEYLQTITRGNAPGLVQLKGSQLAHILERLVDHPRVSLGKSQSVTVTQTPFKPELQATLEASGEIEVRLAPRDSSLPFCLVSDVPSVSSQETDKARTPNQRLVWILRGHQWQPVHLPPAVSAVFAQPVRFHRGQVPLFLSLDWPQLLAAANVEANFRLEDFSFEPVAPRFHLALKGGLAQLEAQLQFRYGQFSSASGDSSLNSAFWLPDAECMTRYFTRDPKAEQAALARLVRSGFSAPDREGQCRLEGQNAVFDFFARDFPRLQKEWQVTLEERLERSTQKQFERIEPRIQASPSGEQWFDLSVQFSSAGGERLSAVDIQQLLLSGHSHKRLRNGKIALLDTGAVEELQEVLLDCNPQQHANGYHLHQSQAEYVAATLRDLSLAPAPGVKDWLGQWSRPGSAPAAATLSLGALETVLRPYQKAGVVWLTDLCERGFGGILADEMGLGKTLQALALLQARHPVDSGASGSPSLVICPTSLVHNWVAEAGRFTPGLRVLALHGPQRQELFARLADCQVVVTSYALLRRDWERYREFTFEIVVLDEAQHIKNRQTQNARAVKGLRCRHRLVLTGTPLENSVLDLWSIFDFLMPGYLGSANDFHERYEQPITLERNPTVQARLARRVRPFVLRRLKREVAPELPPKIEQIVYCDLTEQQRSAYAQILEAGRQEILDAVQSQGLGRSRTLVFTTLLRLRQICCDLRLLRLDQTETLTASAKLDLFSELLEEVLDGGHRALVFSQFTTMLGLLREQLDHDQVDYCYLDGQTANRAEVIQRFQASGAIPVFLISLKAGGLGLNLTGADTVIHYDPWWNPAVEDQATDRAHRLGQPRVVTSYKLIARGTVEEKIVHLQARKRHLLRGALGDESDLGTALTWEEIQNLLAD